MIETTVIHRAHGTRSNASRKLFGAFLEAKPVATSKMGPPDAVGCDQERIGTSRRSTFDALICKLFSSSCAAAACSFVSSTSCSQNSICARIAIHPSHNSYYTISLSPTPRFRTAQRCTLTLLRSQYYRLTREPTLRRILIAFHSATLNQISARTYLRLRRCCYHQHCRATAVLRSQNPKDLCDQSCFRSIDMTHNNSRSHQ